MQVFEVGGQKVKGKLRDEKYGKPIGSISAKRACEKGGEKKVKLVSSEQAVRELRFPKTIFFIFPGQDYNIRLPCGPSRHGALDCWAI
eukprot:12399674-Karenia_brevis.AAC.1